MKKIIPITLLALAALAACATNPTTTTLETIKQPAIDTKKTQVLGILEVELSSEKGSVSSVKFIEAGSAGGLRAQGTAVPINSSNWVFTPGVTTYLTDDTFKYLQNTISLENKTGTSFQNLAMYALNTSSNIGGTAFSVVKDLNGVALTGTTASNVARAVKPTHGMVDRNTEPGLPANIGVEYPSTKADLMIYTPAEAATVKAQLVAPNFVLSNPTVLEYGFLARNQSTGARAIGTNLAACAGANNPTCNKGTITWAFKFPLSLPNSSNLGKFTMRYVVVNEPGSFGVQSIEEQAGGGIAGTDEYFGQPDIDTVFSQLRTLAGSNRWEKQNLMPLCRVRTAIAPDAFLGPDPLPTSSGSLDVCFGASGYRSLRNVIAFGTSYGVTGTSVAVQPDGKIVVGEDTTFAITRYNSNGSLDSSFGTGGTVVTPLTSFFTNTSTAYVNDGRLKSLVVQSDGKVVLAGYISVSAGGTTYYSVLARYNTNGTPDSSFGVGGFVTTANGGVISAIKLQSDGRIVAVGRKAYGAALLRYSSNGTLEGGFGTSVATNTLAGSSEAISLGIQTDGKIVVIGNSNTTRGFWVARFNADSSSDLNFGSNGEVLTPIGNELSDLDHQYSDYVNALAIQNNGKIVVVGETLTVATVNQEYQSYQVASKRPAFARYNSDGSLDSSFSGGRFNWNYDPNNYYYDGNSTAVVGVSVQGNGNIVVAGYSATYPSKIALGFFDPTGTIISSVTTEVGSPYGIATGANALAVQNDGKLVVVGPQVIARYNP
jgi:uncharacterized delta-60 repeat protein